MPEELCQVSPKSHYVSLALHSVPSPCAVIRGSDGLCLNCRCSGQKMTEVHPLGLLTYVARLTPRGMCSVSTPGRCRADSAGLGCVML